MPHPCHSNGCIMANFRKRGSKWQVQVRRAGFPSQTKTFERKDEAQAWARNREVAFDKAEAGIYSPPKNRLSDILARYLCDITPTKKSSERDETHSAFSRPNFPKAHL